MLLPRNILLSLLIAWTALPLSSTRSQTLFDPALQIEPYVFGGNGITSATFFTFIPSDSPGPVDVLITEALGAIKHYRDGQFQSIAIDLPVAFLNEHGLFGIAPHPQFSTNPFFYVYYTSTTTGLDSSDLADVLDNRIVRLTWDGNTLGNEQLIVNLPATPGPNHNGGVLLFGPDDKLYGTIGDLNYNGQLQNFPNGPPPEGRAVIFRLNDDGTSPTTNPFFALGGAMQRVYSYGNRNSFGLDFDPVTDILWNTDNGPAEYDEINLVLPGLNSGWEEIIGPALRSPGSVDSLWVAPGSFYSDPEFSWLQSFGVTAIHFLQADGLGASYENDCFVAAHNSRSVYQFELAVDRMSLLMPDSSVADRVADNDAERDLFLFASDVGVITDIDTGPDGALYLLSFSGQQLWRVSRRVTSDAVNVLPGVGPSQTLVFAPNPFRRRTQVRLRGTTLPHHGLLQIYSPAGQLVRELALPGSSVSWDGRNSRGQRAAGGIYFVRLHQGTGKAPATGKLVLIR